MNKRIFISGVSCVGKDTIGRELSLIMKKAFFDLDHEVEKYFGTSIERLQNKCGDIYTFRETADESLVHILNRWESLNSVISLPPSGFMGPYYKTIKKYGGIKVALLDKPENILKRMTFYDIDSKLLNVKLTKKEKPRYLRSLIADEEYFGQSYKKRADFLVDIEGLSIKEAANKIADIININYISQEIIPQKTSDVTDQLPLFRQNN